MMWLHQQSRKFRQNLTKIKNASSPEYDYIEHDDDTNRSRNKHVILTQEDDINLTKQLSKMSTDSMEDYEFDRITNFAWNDGVLRFNVILRSGKDFEIPFSMMKKDRSIETANYIKVHVTGNKIVDYYNTWDNKTLAQMNQTIRRMHRYFYNYCIMRLSQNK